MVCSGQVSPGDGTASLSVPPTFPLLLTSKNWEETVANLEPAAVRPARSLLASWTSAPQTNNFQLLIFLEQVFSFVPPPP